MFPLAAGCKFYANCDGKKEYYIKWMAIFSFQIIDILKQLSIAQLVYFPDSVPIITNRAVRCIFTRSFRHFTHVSSTSCPICFKKATPEVNIFCGAKDK